MRILYCGNGERGIVCLEALVRAGHEIVAVVANPESTEKQWYRSLSEHARKLELPVFQPRNINEATFVDQVRKRRPQLVVMAGYSQILKKDLLQIPEKGCINLHGGRLPDYRGSSPINWYLINGQSKGGISIVEVNEGIDTGDVIAQQEFEISPHETAKDLLDRTLQLFPPLLIQTIEKIAQGTLNKVPQRPSDGTYYPRRTPADGLIIWELMTAEEIHNLVRALSHPFPGAFTYFKKKKIYVWKASLLGETIRGIPAKICLRRRTGVIVMAKDKGLLVEQVQEENGEETPAFEYFKKTGDSFWGIRESLFESVNKHIE